MKASETGEYETGSLAGLVMKLGRDEAKLDEAYARRLAMLLHDKGTQIRLPLVERLGLQNVVVTVHMDSQIKVIVTGTLSDAPGEITMTWQQEDWISVPVMLLATPVSDPYLFATLDFSDRGQLRRLNKPAGPFSAGQEVTVRALATVGDKLEMRVQALGINLSVNHKDLESIEN
jgi:hypothetical protein